MRHEVLDRLRIATPTAEANCIALPMPSSPHADNRFVRAPLAWLQAAGRLPGRALHVAVVLHFLVAVERSATVALSTQKCAEFGADRFAVYRALLALEEAGLVTVQRQPGCLPLVTVLPTGGGRPAA